MLPADFSAITYPNVWIGSTVVTQDELDRDMPKLIQVPARIRWLSVEPQQEEIWMLPWLNTIGAVGWVVTGGESGSHARPYNAEWARSIIKQCREARIPPFVKQLGKLAGLKHKAGADPAEWPADLRVQEFPA